MICKSCGFQHNFNYCPICSGRSLLNELHNNRKADNQKLQQRTSLQRSNGFCEVVQGQTEHSAKTEDRNGSETGIKYIQQTGRFSRSKNLPKNIYYDEGKKIFLG